MGRVFFDTKKNIVDVAAAKVLTNSDSGTTFIINQASAYEITLPLMSTIDRGWNAEFIIGTVAANAVTIANNTAEDTIVGIVSYSDTDTSNAATATAETAVDEIVFISGAVLGDTVRIVSNGVNYFATAQAHDAAHITIS
tara:strand:- start:106 stop:525 length:420 start_codon:yes stop_codon:yes gene_type:complete